MRLQEDKPYRNEETRSLEEGLPQLEEERLRRAAKSYKATTGVGCDGFHPRAPLDLSKCTTMFFLSSALIRWWEWLRAPQMKGVKSVFVSEGTRLMGAMEVRSVLPGKHCSKYIFL